MKYLTKVKIKLNEYSNMPVEVKPSLPKSLKTLKNLSKYEVHPVFKQILKHPTTDIYDIDPSELIIKTNNLKDNKLTITLNRKEIIDYFDKFEISIDKIKKIEIDKEFIKKQIKKVEKEKKELEPKIELGKKVYNGPQIGK